MREDSSPRRKRLGRTVPDSDVYPGRTVSTAAAHSPRRLWQPSRDPVPRYSRFRMSIHYAREAGTGQQAVQSPGMYISLFI